MKGNNAIINVYNGGMKDDNAIINVYNGDIINHIAVINVHNATINLDSGIMKIDRQIKKHDIVLHRSTFSGTPWARHRSAV